MIPERQASELDEFIYEGGNSTSDILIFACDVTDITECQVSTLHAKRAEDAASSSEPTVALRASVRRHRSVVLRIIHSKRLAHGKVGSARIGR
jgi:hypothetical protein